MGLAGKIRSVLAFRKLQPVTKRVVKENLTYLSVAKLMRIEGAICETADIPGDILEFGVALGGSGIILAHDARPDRRFHGFDVFGTIPPPTSEKDDVKSKDRYQIIMSGQSKGLGGAVYYGYRKDLFSAVKSSFASYGVPVDGRSVVLHQGLFEETWANTEVSQVALVHIDCDWYDPVKFCLEACANRLSIGEIIIIDDYNDYGGCRIAVDEFLAERRDFTIEQGANPLLRKRPSELRGEE